MAKIDKVSGFNLGQKIANPFKTSRSMSTPNPFKYSNFEGNTLPFADVFEGFENKNVSKMRMISSSVVGSMNKFRSSITEPIVNFVNRIGAGISNAWNYAKNTNVSDLINFEGINNVMKMDVKDIGKGISNSISEMNRNISDKMPKFSMPSISMPSMPSWNVSSSISGLGKGLSDRWSNLVNKINIPHHENISSDMPVCELEARWKSINAESTLKESKVA